MENPRIEARIPAQMDRREASKAEGRNPEGRRPEMTFNDSGEICPNCGSTRTYIRWLIKDNLYNTDYRAPVFECHNCGFMFHGYPPKDTSILYPKNYSPHISLADTPKKYGKFLTILKRIKDKYYSNKLGLVPELSKYGNVLEIGCSNGNNLAELWIQGWNRSNIYGIELVDEAAQKAWDKGFNVISGDAETALKRFPDGFFDVIIASMVIEHIQNPGEFVKTISKKLTPSGQFLFSTAQRDSIDYWIYKGYWVAFDVRHMVYFRKQDIKDMLKDQFKDVKFYHQLGAIDFIRSSTWRLKDGRGNVFDKIVLVLGEGLLNVLLVPFSLAGLTTRVSIHARLR